MIITENFKNKIIEGVVLLQANDDKFIELPNLPGFLLYAFSFEGEKEGDRAVEFEYDGEKYIVTMK